ncbi:MAG: hypothetical protein AAF704_00710, partial [Cyanobacteria bacterium P01_D01_bin.123]
MVQYVLCEESARMMGLQQLNFVRPPWVPRAFGLVLVCSMVSYPPAAIAQASPPERAASTLAQRPTSPQLDDSLSELRSTFSELESTSTSSFATSSPAFSIAIPSGYGLSFGSAYFGVGGTLDRRLSDESVFGFGFGFGLGNAATIAGLETNFSALDVDNGISTLSLKLHRIVLNSSQVGWAIAAGWEDLASSGGTGLESSVYGSTTVLFKLRPSIDRPFSRMALTVGVGGGRFRTESDIQNGSDSLGVFGGLALRMTPSTSAILEWTGQDLAAGVSIAPFRNFNLFVTPGVRDIAGAGDSARL